MIQTGGKYYVVDKSTGEVIGESSHNPLDPVILVGSPQRKIHNARRMVTTIVVAFFLCASFLIFSLIQQAPRNLDVEMFDASVHSSDESDPPAQYDYTVYYEIDEMTSTQIFQNLLDREGPEMVAWYLDSYTDLRFLYHSEDISNLYVYAFCEGYHAGKANEWNQIIEEYIDGYEFSESDADYYSSFSPYG